MKTRAQAFFSWIRRHYVLSVIILVVVLLIASEVFGGKGNGNAETITLVPQEFLRTVEISGKVTPAQDVELGFETTGRVTSVNYAEGSHVQAGATLATLSSGDASADVLKAQADLDAEIARLNELQGGSNGADTSLDISERELYEAISDAYTRSDDAIRNNVDQFYDGYDIIFAFNDYDLKLELNKTRRSIELMLKKWRKRLDQISTDTYIDTDVQMAEDNLSMVKSFLDRVALAVNKFEVYSGPYSQAEIDKFKSDISGARNDINAAISDVVTAKDSVRDIESEIPYQEAKVKAAQATLKSYQSELYKRVITAPFTGVITKQDAKVGQIVSANTVVMRLISDANFTIETFVPEINIKEVQVGNIAKVTLDAYGEDQNFDAKVISIDPGETIKDGVSTYKVLFEFTAEDSRLKSGMTANVTITTETKPDALLIPQEAVVKRDGFSYAYVIVGKEKVEKQITTGSVASNGYIEVIAGLSAGEVVVKNAQ